MLLVHDMSQLKHHFSSESQLRSTLLSSTRRGSLSSTIVLVRHRGGYRVLLEQSLEGMGMECIRLLIVFVKLCDINTIFWSPRSLL